PGTENVAGAVALGRAALLAVRELEEHTTRLKALRDRLCQRLKEVVPELYIHCSDAPRAPHVLSVSVPGAEAEALLMHLDLAGICVSGGSACSTGAVEPSHVLTAMGIDRPLALGTIRFSLGHETTPADIARVAEVFPSVVTKVRGLGVALGRA